VNTVGSTERLGDVNVEDQTVDAVSKGSVEDDRERLRIIYELSKHVWEDNAKRNFRLLRKIHEYSNSATRQA
jgi:hypothetical protein